MSLLQLTPTEFEQLVFKWLKSCSSQPQNVEIKHLGHIKGYGGEYEIDIVIEFEVFGGAFMRVLVECKRYNAPVSREKVQVLESKIRDTNSNKGMLFSTSGFQSGAVEFAQKYNIATLHVTEQGVGYQTKSRYDNYPERPKQILPGFVVLGESGFLSTKYSYGVVPVYIKEWIEAR